MKIRINGEGVDAPDGAALAELLQLQSAPPYAATAVNGVFVPRSRRADLVLRDGDEIEILTPMQGG